jgi:ribosome-binding factor A
VGFATVTTVKMTNDLKIAKVYISVLDTRQKDKEIETFFNSRAKFLRGRLGSHLTSKSIPELKFFYDDTYEEAEKIDRLIAKIQPQ